MNMATPPEDSNLPPPESVNDTGGALASPDVHYPGKGFQLGPYVITSTLGHGSMATVFLAEDTHGHECALKVFQEGPGVSATMLERFRREIEATKKLRRHPNILTVYDTGQQGPYHYIAMASVENSTTLDDFAEEKNLSKSEIIELVIKIARALDYAHRRDVIHRDVKPTNILIDEFGEPQLTDFGVAELIDLPTCTVSGALTGTPLYMSPEQARGERVGKVSDIYSLGVVLYELLCEVLPYADAHSGSIKAVLEAVTSELPVRPRVYRKEVTADLEAVMLKALEKDIDDRYTDIEYFAEDLQKVIEGRAVSAARVWPVVYRVENFVRRYKTEFLTGLSILLIAAAGGKYLLNQFDDMQMQRLVSMAQLQNSELKLAQAGYGKGYVGQTPQAWQEIRLARRAMAERKWDEAREHSMTAALLTTAIGDDRTTAIAQLDRARSETMLHRVEAAKEIYASIIKSPNTSPAIYGLAQLEWISLCLMERKHEEAQQILLKYDRPADGPSRTAINCLAGDLQADELLLSIPSMPKLFRNDAYYAAALVSFVDRSKARYMAMLMQCIKHSTPSSEWPAPLVRELFMKGGG